jgi:hypothetical protein
MAKIYKGFLWKKLSIKAQNRHVNRIHSHNVNSRIVSDWLFLYIVTSKPASCFIYNNHENSMADDKHLCLNRICNPANPQATVKTAL